eukprot:s1878_g29.t1
MLADLASTVALLSERINASRETVLQQRRKSDDARAQEKLREAEDDMETQEEEVKTLNASIKSTLENVLAPLRNATKAFEKDSIPEGVAAKLKAQVSRSEMDPPLVESQSKAAKCIAVWLRALSSYDDVYRSLAESREEATRKEEEVQEELERAQKKAEEAEEDFSKAEDDLNVILEEHEKKKQQHSVADRVMNIEGHDQRLSATRPRWEEHLESLRASSTDLPNECLFVAAVISMGFLVPAERAIRRNALVKVFQEYELTLTLSPQALPWEDHEDSDDHDENDNHDGREGVEGEDDDADAPDSESESEDEFENFLPTFLLDQLVADEWQSMGLPRFLAESAAIASHVLRPLCVDPQEQALSWLRKRVDFVTHVGSPKLQQALQHCSEGRSLLLLGVTDQLPACVVEFHQPQTEVEQKEPKGSPSKSSASLGEEERIAPLCISGAEKDSKKSKKGKGKIFVVTPDLPRSRQSRDPPALPLPLDVVNFEVLEVEPVEQILLRAMSKDALQLQAASLKDFPSNQREFLQLEEKIQLLLAEGASHKTGVLGDNDLMLEISTSRCRCCELQEMNQEALLFRRSFVEKRRHFLSAARSCARLFRAMQRLAQLGTDA